ncbi:MAG TPA: ABC transporter substrate-binding protein [Acetobacteraceae bacterium]|nr:ABC transporter substrate-binding protein [Acetobacteraceae bacterium]
MNRAALGGLLLSFVFAATAMAQISDDVVRIGVLTDETGPYADSAGPGSVAAARMAAEDFGGTVRGKRIEIVHADTQNKPDVASTVARRWFDSEKVDAVIDLPVTPIALAVQEIAKQKNRTVMITASAASEFTSKFCSPVSTHWADDTHALAAGTARALVAQGGGTWFFITVDQTFGLALERDATEVVKAAGGKVLGAVRHPIGATDYSSLLLQAQASGAKVVGLASVGGDLVNLLKQANEFGLTRDGTPTMAGFLIYIQDVHALGLEATQGLTFTSGFYWDQDDKARAFGRRFLAQQGMMPSKNHALIYTAVTQYLRAVDAAGTDEAVAVNRVMRDRPFRFFGKDATIRGDGRVLYEETLWRVKRPQESREAWDYYAKVRTIPAADAFLAPNREACGGG